MRYKCGLEYMDWERGLSIVCTGKIEPVSIALQFLGSCQKCGVLYDLRVLEAKSQALKARKKRKLAP